MEDMLLSVREFLMKQTKTRQDLTRIEEILDAMEKVDRKYFAPYDPYLDTSLPIGYNQTISQPSTVGRMLMLANLVSGNQVLEIGSGSGWNAALIAYLVHPGAVTSLEIIPELTALSKKNVAAFREAEDPEVVERLSKLSFYSLNIFEELEAWNETYDRIIFTAGLYESEADTIDKVALKLLNEKGIMVCPKSLGPIIVVNKVKGKLEKWTTREAYGFVPLLTH